MIYQARSKKDNKLFIRVYETEEPKKEDFINGPEYLRALTQWQSSMREYEVRGEYKEEIEQLIWNTWVHDKQGYSQSDFYYDLEKGIDCTFLKERLKLDKEPCRKCFECKNLNVDHWSTLCKNPIQVWTLLPLKDKEEEIEAVEFAEWACRRIEGHRAGFFRLYSGDVVTMKSMYKQFKLTRITNNKE